MATKTIGSAAGRDYATVGAWFAAIPATLTANEIGLVYNDSEFILTAQSVFGGKTVGSFTITLQPATGQGFADSKANAGFKLGYVPSQGAAFSSVTSYIAGMIYLSQAGMTIQGLQFKTTAGNSFTAYHNGNAGAVYKNCIFDGAGITGNTTYSGVVRISGGTLINSLVVARGAVPQVLTIEYGAVITNVTVVAASGTPGQGVAAGAGTNTVTNTTSFGCATAFIGTSFTAASNYNINDGTTAPGANSLQSKLFANQFVTTTDDFRLKAGADCIAKGYTDATNAPLDIVGTTRGLTTLGSIGAWEYVAASAPTLATATSNNATSAASLTIATALATNTTNAASSSAALMTAAAGSLFRSASLSGMGSGGRLFNNPLN
jgi:hypothetical protein